MTDHPLAPITPGPHAPDATCSRHGRFKGSRCGGFKPRRWVARFVALLLALLLWSLPLGGTGLADAIQLDRFWIDNITLQGIEEGHLIYTTSIGTDVTRPLAELKGIKVTAYPLLNQAQEAIDRGDDAAALERFNQVRHTVREPWLRHWITYQLLGLYDRLNLPVEAVESLVVLAREGAPLYYFRQGGLASIRATTGRVRSDLRERLTMAAAMMTGSEHSRLLRELAETLTPIDTPTGDENTSVPAEGPWTPTPADTATSSVVTLPRVMSRQDQVTRWLAQGRFDQALSQVDALLASEASQLPMRLYQRGVAQLGLAQASGQRGAYLDAGLSFLRVITYFSRSSYAGPSLVEAGLVHNRIGRPDLARKLYDKATVLIDPEVDPDYSDRLQALATDLAN